jgi:hypothetical protein
MRTNKPDRWPRWGTFRNFLSILSQNRQSFDERNWVHADESLAEHNVMWAQYGVFVDLYKHYLDIVWKASIGYYVVTGVTLAYYFDNAPDDLPGPLPILLVFIALVSLGFAILYLRAAADLAELRDLLEAIARKLRLPGRPHVEFAVDFLIVNALFFLLVLVAVLGLFLFQVDQLAWP